MCLASILLRVCRATEKLLCRAGSRILGGWLRSLCPNGPRGGMRPGPCNDAIMFGPYAQKRVGVFLARILIYYKFMLVIVEF